MKPFSAVIHVSRRPNQPFVPPFEPFVPRHEAFISPPERLITPHMPYMAAARPLAHLPKASHDADSILRLNP